LLVCYNQLKVDLTGPFIVQFSRSVPRSASRGGSFIVPHFTAFCQALFETFLFFFQSFFKASFLLCLLLPFAAQRAIL
ncbi:MAG: hypothetical protein IKA51_00790, partial [Clostridia bacterium]|nr:hypothetical protein [Clostridia bacterium]